MNYQRPTLLPYTKITHNGADVNGWVVIWDPAPRKPPELSNNFALARDGIGTVVIRDGLKCPGPGKKFFEILAEIPSAYFQVVAGTGYKITISNVNPRGPRGWEFDLVQTCMVSLSYYQGIITVKKDPDYIPRLH